MPALSEYNNVYNTALFLLQQEGYQVWYEKESELYCAEKDGWDFKANSLCGLLGLVFIYKHKQPSEFVDYWWREEGPDHYHDLPQQPRDYKPVWKKPK